MWWDTWYERTTLSLPSTRLFYLRFREILHLLIFLHFTCHTNLDPITPLHLFPLGGAVQPVFDEIEPLLFVIALVEAGRGFAPHTMLQPYWSTAMLKFQICVFRIYQTKHQPPSAHRGNTHRWLRTWSCDRLQACPHWQRASRWRIWRTHRTLAALYIRCGILYIWNHNM